MKTDDKIARMAKEIGMSPENINLALGNDLKFSSAAEAKLIFEESRDNTEACEIAWLAWNELIEIQVDEADTVEKLKAAFEICPNNDKRKGGLIIREIGNKWDYLSLQELSKADTIEEIKLVLSNACVSGFARENILSKWLEKVNTVDEINEVLRKARRGESVVKNILTKLANLLTQAQHMKNIWECAKENVNWHENTTEFEILVISKWINYSSTLEELDYILSQVNSKHDSYKTIRIVAEDRKDKILLESLKTATSIKEVEEINKLSEGESKAYQASIDAWKRILAENAANIKSYHDAYCVLKSSHFSDSKSESIARKKMLEFVDEEHVESIYLSMKTETEKAEAGIKWLSYAKTIRDFANIFHYSSGITRTKSLSEWIKLVTTIDQIFEFKRAYSVYDDEKELLDAKIDELLMPEIEMTETVEELKRLLEKTRNGSKAQKAIIKKIYTKIK